MLVVFILILITFEGQAGEAWQTFQTLSDIGKQQQKKVFSRCLFAVKGLNEKITETHEKKIALIQYHHHRLAQGPSVHHSHHFPGATRHQPPSTSKAQDTRGLHSLRQLEAACREGVVCCAVNSVNGLCKQHCVVSLFMEYQIHALHTISHLHTS
jgi:hypothetical protein